MKKYYNMSCGAICEIGDKKPTNQDCIFTRISNIDGNSIGLFIVADGVGGLVNGDVISNIIALHFEKWFNELESGKIKRENRIRALDAAIETVNKMSYEYSETVGEKMGSTIALLLVIDDKFYVRNIGDSRVYYLDNKKNMMQLSQDHSYVAELVRKGQLSEEEAKYHPKRNVLISCVGVTPEVNTFATEGTFKKDAEFLICSDGFYNYSDAEKAHSVLNDKKKSEQEKAHLLRACIPDGNAKDNVSIVLVKVKSIRRFF